MSPCGSWTPTPILVFLLVLSMAVSVSAATDAFVYDDADLLTEGERAELSGRLSKLGDTYNVQVVPAGQITGKSLQGQLKTVRKQHQAKNYVKSGSMNLTEQEDVFLYSDIQRTEKDTDSDDTRSSGGSSRSTGGETGPATEVPTTLPAETTVPVETTEAPTLPPRNHGAGGALPP